MGGAFELRALMLAAFCAACARAAHPSTLSNAPIDLATGQSVSMETKGLREYGVDGQGIVEVRATKGKLTITALQPGETLLYLVDREGTVVRRTIHVAFRAPATPAAEERDALAEQLASFTCVRIVPNGATWAVEATPRNDTERLQLEQLKEDYVADKIELRFVPAACAAAASDAGPEPDAAP